MIQMRATFGWIGTSLKRLVIQTHCHWIAGKQSGLVEPLGTQSKETSVNALSDGNVPEKVLPIIPHAAYHCKNGYRAVVLTEMLKPGSYRLYGFARRTGSEFR